MSSAELSRQIYTALGPAGLESRTSPVADDETTELVLRLVERTSGRVLDAGCGYGRIAIPLAERGYDVVGIDICPAMLAEARQRGQDAKVEIDWLHGDIGDLPFADGSFDVVLCLWLTFHELLQQDEQLSVLRELHRVLAAGGVALLDGPPFQKQGDDEPISGVTALTEDEEELAIVGFGHLLDEVGVTKYEQFVDDCPGRPRQFLRWWK